jgi:hypothetical protein
MEHEILIQNFDFVTHHLKVYVGDKIRIRLGNSVPVHAEHVIYGKSDAKQLCFESTVLQVSVELLLFKS